MPHGAPKNARSCSAPREVKLLVDMNLSPRWVVVLADAGIEAVRDHRARGA